MTAQSVSLAEKPAQKRLTLWIVLKRTAPLILGVCPLYLIVSQSVAIVHGLSTGVGTWSRQLLKA